MRYFTNGYRTAEIKVDGYRAAEIKAASLGSVVVPADDSILQIDIDSEEDFKKWEDASAVLLKLIDPVFVTIHESASGYPHRHINVKLKEDVDIWKRIALQILLGSHTTREMMNACRVLTNEENPIVFFEPYKGRRMMRPVED